MISDLKDIHILVGSLRKEHVLVHLQEKWGREGDCRGVKTHSGLPCKKSTCRDSLLVDLILEVQGRRASGGLGGGDIQECFKSLVHAAQD